jgi:hypothetical protein
VSVGSDRSIVGGDAGASHPRLVAFCIYLTLTLILFGPTVLPHLNDRVITTLPGDWSLFAWSFRWWPHAIAHGIDPLFTRELWYPYGLNLAWTTSTPVPSLVLAPITFTAGPVAAFNLASLLAPTMAAWTAFILYMRLMRRSFGPSLAGGLVFGFSPYVMAQLVSGHLNLSLALMIPVFAYLVVRLLDGSMSARRFVVMFTGCLVIQFGISTELFVTVGLFGGLAAAAAAILMPARRSELIRAMGLVGLSYVAAAALVSPYLYAAFAYPQPYKALFTHPLAPIPFSELARIFVPGSPEIFGRSFGQPGTRPWFFHLERFGWYVPAPLLAIVFHLWRTERRRPAVMAAVLVFVAALAFGLGPYLGIGSHRIPMPWWLVQKLPLVNRAFPYRMMAYAALALGACVAYWLASSPRAWRRWAVFAAGGLLLIPNIANTSLWARDVSTPPFFATGQFRSAIAPGAVLWVICPEGGDQMLWQAQSGMYFRLAGGYTGVTPPDLLDPVLEYRLISGDIQPADSGALAPFVQSHHVDDVVLAGEPTWVIQEVAQALGVSPEGLGGITLMRLQPHP